MPKYHIEGSLEYCKPEDGYLETDVEAPDEDAALQLALAGYFSPRQLATYTINEYLEVTEVEDEDGTD